MKKPHIHVYKFVKTIQVVSFAVSSTYEDWACIHEGCTKMLRKGILHPPSRRLPKDE